MVIGGGYKAVTDCTEPSYSISYPGQVDDNSDVILGDGKCLTAGLKTKPVDRPSAAAVMQMPTTGAPEGLSTAGLIAVGVGLLALGVGLAKRRSF